MNAKQVSDAKRLAVTLDQYADDPATVKRLAAALHYTKNQNPKKTGIFQLNLKNMHKFNIDALCILTID